MQKLNTKNLTLFLLILMHIAGIIGLHWSVTYSYFKYLIGFNLILTAVLLFSFQKKMSIHFIIAISIAFLGGFGVEVLGVHTGIIFGIYHYEWALGGKLMKVPILIGLNWAVLIYCCAHLADKFDFLSNHFLIQKIFKSVIVASCMTFLDFFIEPFAIKFEMWQWKDNLIPVQNFVGWWITSLILSFIFFSFPFERKNPLAIPLFFILCGFFFIIYLLNIFL
jgi:putative membrane protein